MRQFLKAEISFMCLLTSRNKNLLASSIRTLAVALLLTCGINTLWAAGGGGIVKTYATILSGDASMANTSLLQNNAVAELRYTPQTEQTRTIQNIITLKVFEETQSYIPTDFTASINLKIEYGPLSGPLNELNPTLQVNYKKGESLSYNAKNYLTFKNAEFVKITVLHIDAPTVSGFDPTRVLMLQNEMRVTQFFDLKQGVLPITLTDNTGSNLPERDALEVAWSWPSDAGNNYTQLEWTWVEDELANNYTTSGTIDYELLFKHNATRLDLGVDQTGYSIPLFYDGQGKLYYRIRAVNLKADGTRQEGPWKVCDNPFSFSGHEPDLNWQVTTSYAEEGKRKTIMQYFDGSLRNRQTVTKDNSTHTTVVAETFYDGQGRPAIQVLPTPGLSTVIAYTKNLNLFNGQSANEDPAKYFDLQPISGTPSSTTPGLSTGSGASHYYSALNKEINEGSNKSLPDAEGYPYTVTRYAPDASGRVMAQSGVGTALKMGSGHEIRYYYGTASQQELDGLFGTEVGNFTHYSKNMVRDANGQMSVSYVDMHGRTIATALAGEAPSPTTALNLSEYPGQSGTTLSHNLLDPSSNVIKGTSIESVTSLLVPAATNYHFKYELNPQALQLATCTQGVNVCHDCLYDLEISITDESGDGVPVIKKISNVSLNPDDDCSTPTPGFKYENNILSTVVTFDQLLQPGSYAVRKTLTISEVSLQKYKDQYLVKALCQSEEDVINSVYQQLLTTSDCNNPVVATCETCNAALGTLEQYKAKYLSDAGINTPTADQLNEIQAAYTAAQQNCERLCLNKSHRLQTIEEIMLSDMMPSTGQYAKVDAPASDPFNIFSLGNPATHPFYKHPVNSNGNPDYYYTPLNSVDLSIHPGGSSDDKQTLLSTTKEDFVQLFATSWARSLLPYHPEYKKLTYAKEHLTGSYDWMDQFSGETTYAGAVARNFLTVPDNDPFYNLTETGTRKPGMQSQVNNYFQQNLSMWQIAYGNITCKSITDNAQRSQCYTNLGTLPLAPPYSNLTASQNDQLWNNFEGLYAAARDKDVITFLTDMTPEVPTTVLSSQGYSLRFPVNNSQLAAQAGWTWYSDNPTTGPTPPPTSASATDVYASRCSGTIIAWTQTLTQCSALANHPQKDAIISEITSGMVAVCKKGSDEENPFGSSTVAPNTPVDGSPRSFEEVINSVFQQYGIVRDTYCNPFVIDYPKPYGKGPTFDAQEYVTQIKSCQCDRFRDLKQEAYGGNYDTLSFASMNQFFLSTYGSTLTPELFEGMQHCSELNQPTYYTTSSFYLLPSPQPLPAFLKCDYANQRRCLTCADLKYYINKFKSEFGAPYNTAPLFNQGDLTEEEISYNVLFQQFLNSKTGLQYTWEEYAQAAAAANCDLLDSNIHNSGQNVICPEDKALNDASDDLQTDPPCQQVYDKAVALGQQIYQMKREQALADFENQYQSKCLAAQSIEQFSVTYANKEYHYTLYYYDRAGNLVKTVPPKGVRPDFSKAYTDQVEADRLQEVANLRPHMLTTDYRYNSLNQVVAQNSPDAHTSLFWYDKVGRLAVSQNAQQALDGKYSYTLYDALGRIVEVGQKPQPTAMTQAISQDETALQNWIVTDGGIREQITETVYDVLFGCVPGNPNTPCTNVLSQYMTQENLRNRVSYTYTMKLQTDVNEVFATYYTYDIHGNVDKLVQDYEGIPEMLNTDNHYKVIAYDYDLISGKVNGVSYQPDQADAFYHRYNYDAENRLMSVETSRDKILWEREAAYSYYKHGPLSRMILGEQQVQGMDYAYTLQGWLKAVNSTSVDPLNDIGGDGTSASTVARDVLGFGLHYYDDGNALSDYKPVGTIQSFARPVSQHHLNSLFNGNIAAITMNNTGLSKGTSTNTTAVPLFYNYHYDQLNRLVAMQAYKGLNASTNQWTPLQVQAITDYKEAVTYDPNGNILHYLRNGAPSLGKPEQMDDLTYDYYENSNQLRHVGDGVLAAANYSNDIDNQSNASNYTYDAIGNLKSDASEGITNIDWTVYGKIATITKGSSAITYSYDASGNRISKTVGNKTTIYVRDAQGNVLAVYEKQVAEAIHKTESHSYGSSRLGMVREPSIVPTEVAISSGYEPAKLTTFTRGEKTYELTNHLGNVLATISDKKGMVASSGDASVIDHYEAVVLSASDYYPFGMLMPGRKGYLSSSGAWTDGTSIPQSLSVDYRSGNTPLEYRAGQEIEFIGGFESGDNGDEFSTNLLEGGTAGNGTNGSGNDGSGGSYRYGFNGKENDNEVKGEGNQIDFGARIYDPRVGRWMAVDPLAAKYPFSSPYDFALNTPIQAIDPDGKLVIFVNGYRPSLPGVNIYREIKRDDKVFKGDKLEYWSGVDNKFMNRINDHNAIYADGDAPTLIAKTKWGFNSRVEHGRQAGQDLISKINSGEVVLQKNDKGEVIESIKVVAHSMGYAYSIGMINELEKAGYKVEVSYNLAPENPTAGNIPGSVKRSVQYGSGENQPWYYQDRIAPQKKIKNVNEKADIPDKNSNGENIPAGPYDSHAVSNYGKWIFGIPQGQEGAVAPRQDTKAAPKQ